MTATIETAATFTADRKQLLAAATWAAKGLPRRPAVPVLAGMHVTVADGAVRLAGFDYELTASAGVPASATVDGACLATGRDLVAAIKGMPAGKGATVTAEVRGDALVVTSGGVTASAGLLPLEDYPDLPAMPPAAGVMASDAFRLAVTRVAAAAGKDDTLPALRTVNMVTSSAGITLAATDRYRLATDFLAWTPADLADATDYPWTLQVPEEAAVMFAKAAVKGGKVTLHIAEAKHGDAGSDYHSTPPMVGLTDGERELITRTGDSEFPRYEKLWPAEFHGLAECDAGSLVAAVKRAGQAVEKNIPVHLLVRRDGITIKGYRDGAVSYSETVPGSCESDATDNGRKVSGWLVAYSADYLASMVAGVTGTVRLEWPDLNKPMQVTAADPDDKFRALVCGVRIQRESKPAPKPAPVAETQPEPSAEAYARLNGPVGRAIERREAER